MLARLGDDRRVALLFGAADADVDASRVTGTDAARMTALSDRLRERLGPAVFAEARQESGALARTDVVGLALAAQCSRSVTSPDRTQATVAG